MTDAKWIDISQPLTNGMAHWPGDTPFSFSTTVTMEESGSANVGEIAGSLHIGTHIDAPFHYDSEGKTIDALDLERYIGKARVIDLSHTDQLTRAAFEAVTWENMPERLLLRTSLLSAPERFPETFPVLDPDVAPFLREKGVRLLGVNTPSVDPVESGDLPVHHALYDNDINILENVVLDGVEAGDYELIALPLAIKGADGSPVRAVIRPTSGG